MAHRNPSSLIARRNSLVWWLAGINVLIVLVVSAGVYWSASLVLSRLADGQQRTRVQLAAADVRAAMNRVAEDTLTYARVLSERPTLRRLLHDADRDTAESFLARFCTTASLDACAVAEGDTVRVTAGRAVAWPAILTAVREQGERFKLAPAGSPDAYLGAAATLDEPGSTLRVVVLHVLDDGFTRLLGPQDGLQIRLRNYRSFGEQPVDEITALHTTAMADGRGAVDRIRPLGIYAASLPVFSPNGEGIVLIEARLSSALLDAEVHGLELRLLVTVALLGVLAVLAGVLLGQRVTGPTEALTTAAARLGQGDFAAPIPTGGPAEIGQLARTMDDMRRNLVGLTDTLRQREAEAQAVLGGIVEGVYAVDQARRITYMNDTAGRLLGVSPREAIGRPCEEVLGHVRASDGRPSERLCPPVQGRDVGDRASVTTVEQLVTPAGERRMVITSSRPVQGLQVQVLRDETELEAVRRARDTVLANLSHEFRTPLSAQLASIELLREGLATQTPAQREELVLSLERGTLRLTQLIDNLLESVRIESGQLGIRRQSVDLAEVVDEALATVGPLLRQRGQRVERHLGEPLELEGDAVRLTQVLVNLLANAIKFAPAGSVLRVGAEGDEARVRAWVDDSGPGLPEGAHESVFERFGRGGVEPAPGGMGLGLAISRSIVERHGGTLAATRTADGHTRFLLDLPREIPS